MKDEISVKRLFEAAHKDPVLRRRLLLEPRTVSKEWGVELDERAVERLTKLGAFVELAEEVAQGSVFSCDPTVCYPVRLWHRNAAAQLVRSVIRIPDPIFYPAEVRVRLEDVISRRLGMAGRGW